MFEWGMTSYTRPTIEHGKFCDAAGDVIHYGDRWGMDGPPEGAYGVVSHAERYSPLHTVADAFIKYLVENYDVEVFDGLSAAADLDVTYEGVVDRAVRVTPRYEGCAPLTIVFTPYPGILLHPGNLDETFFPVCGCDACDEAPEQLVDDLERAVLAAIQMWR